jgi:hypothetical protein
MKTAYSNSKNRMKLSENKRSIAGKVHVVKNCYGQIFVFPEDVNIEGYLSMYMNVYHHSKDPSAHYCIIDTWSTIQKRVIEYLDVEELRNDITLSNQIKSKTRLSASKTKEKSYDYNRSRFIDFHLHLFI